MSGELGLGLWVRAILHCAGNAQIGWLAVMCSSTLLYFYVGLHKLVIEMSFSVVRLSI